jgi:hypothetical protein
MLPATMDSAPLAVNAERQNGERNGCIFFVDLLPTAIWRHRISIARKTDRSHEVPFFEGINCMIVDSNRAKAGTKKWC